MMLDTQIDFRVAKGTWPNMRSKQDRNVIPTQFFSTQTQKIHQHPKSSKQIIINHRNKSLDIRYHHTFMSTHHLQHRGSPPIRRKQTYLSHLQCVSSLGSTYAPPCFEVGHPAALPGPLIEGTQDHEMQFQFLVVIKTGFQGVG